MAIQGPPPIKIRFLGSDETKGTFKDIRGNLGGLSKLGDVGFGGIVKGLGAIGIAAGVAKFAIDKLKMGLGEMLKLDQQFARLKFTEGFSDIELEMVQKSVRSISKETGIAQEEIVGAIDKVGDAGFNLAQTMEIVRKGAKAAKAFGQPLNIFADQAFTLGANLKVPFEQMEQALDIAAQIGTTNLDIDTLNKLLADAGLSAQSLGLEGVAGLRQIGAALQVVRTGVKDSGKGMRAFSGVLREAISEESIKKFKEGFGVDLMSEIGKRVKEGDTEFAAYLKTVDKVTRSNDKLDREQRFNFLFSGEQVGAVRALVDKLDELQAAYQKTGEAGGTIERGFKLQKETMLEIGTEMDRGITGLVQDAREMVQRQSPVVGKGIERGSDARRLLAEVDSSGPRVPRGDTTIFRGIKSPIKKQRTLLFGDEERPIMMPKVRPSTPKEPVPVVPAGTPGQAVIDINFNNVPPGVQVRTRSDKNTTINPNLGMSFAR